MKASVMIEQEIEISFLRLDVAVRYDDEDMPYDFPQRQGDRWKVIIEIDTGKIVGWPKGVSHAFNMKVCDQGTYELLDRKMITIKLIENDYVPNHLIPGSYGDYIDFEINEDGVITNWPRDPDFVDFFGDDIR